MVLASLGPPLTPPSSSCPPKTPIRSYSAQTPPRNWNQTQTPTGSRGCSRLGRGMGGQNSPRQTRTLCYTPATARLHRGSPLTTLQPSKQQPATAGVVERGGRVTTARRTTTRAAPAVPLPHTDTVNALRQFTMHISTNDLHCCKPARLLQ
jgi:hypothetical protein